MKMKDVINSMYYAVSIVDDDTLTDSSIKVVALFENINEAMRYVRRTGYGINAYFYPITNGVPNTQLLEKVPINIDNCHYIACNSTDEPVAVFVHYQDVFSYIEEPRSHGVYFVPVTPSLLGSNEIKKNKKRCN